MRPKNLEQGGHFNSGAVHSPLPAWWSPSPRARRVRGHEPASKATSKFKAPLRAQVFWQLLCFRFRLECVSKSALLGPLLVCVWGGDRARRGLGGGTEEASRERAKRKAPVPNHAPRAHPRRAVVHAPPWQGKARGTSARGGLSSAAGPPRHTTQARKGGVYKSLCAHKSNREKVVWSSGYDDSFTPSRSRVQSPV